MNLGKISSPNHFCVVGFDSAWSGRNKGSICIAEVGPFGVRPLYDPQSVDFCEAASAIRTHTSEKALLLMIDQPIIVKNKTGGRPVESAVGSLVGKLRGGIQRACKQKNGGNLFGDHAPIWAFLKSVDVIDDPMQALELKGKRVCIETYPCLAVLGLFPEFLKNRSVAKYNPTRKTFRQSDWNLLCQKVAGLLAEAGLDGWAERCKKMADMNKKPSKQEQDKLDALICLLSGLVFWRHGFNASMIIGDTKTGYIVSPANALLVERLRALASLKKVSLHSSL